MHKVIFSLLISLLTINAGGQENEIKAMYSPVPLHRMDDWGRDLDGLTARYAGAFMIDYNRYLNPRLKLGFNVTYDQVKESGTKTDTFRRPDFPYDYITTTHQHSNRESLIFFGPQLGFDYIQNDNFRFGSLVGLSMVVINWEDVMDSRIIGKGTSINAFFHAELINFTWGKTKGLTGQLGYGHKGLISLGYFFRW